MTQIETLDGIPPLDAATALVESESYDLLEQASSQFIRMNRELFKRYSRRWVTNPLRQWSRLYEYPYAFNRLSEHCQGIEKPKILDAGSGFTFFPYVLRDQLGAEVTCLDSDSSLRSLYDHAIAETIHSNLESNSNDQAAPKPVSFCQGTLDQSSAADQFYDCLYCISVLEHTENYEAILTEFCRVLKPGGMLVLTFDISVDGNRDIPVDRAETLLKLIEKYFLVQTKPNAEEPLSKRLSDTSRLFTSQNAQRNQLGDLPWRWPSLVYQIREFTRSGKWIQWPPNLTVYCVHAIRR